MRVAIVVGLLGVAGLAADCGGGGTGQGEDADLRIYLGENGKMYKWEEKIHKAICQLEEQSTGIPDAEKYCPEGTPTGTAPPKYPPAQ